MELETGLHRKTRVSRQRTTEGAIGIRVTDRDLWILEALGKMRFLRTKQLARLFFDGSRSAANKRLRRLFDHSLVKVWITGLADDNLYSLTTRGRSQLEDHGANLHCPRGVEGNLDHLLAINDTRIAFVLGTLEFGVRLCWWHSDWDLRTHARASLVPDALFAVDWPEVGPRTYSLELDHNTKSPREFLKKLTGYRGVTYRAGGLYGEDRFTILVVGHSRTWIERYRSLVRESALDLHVLFAALEDVCRMGPLAPIWLGNGSNEPVLLQARTPPYRKEGFAEETDGESRRCGDDAARVLPVEGCA